MINRQFNNLCPFCNHQLIVNKNKYFACNNCPTKYIEFQYFADNLYLIVIHQHNTKDTLVINFSEKTTSIIKLKQFQFNKKITLSKHIPDFSSLQDILDILNTLILFQ